MSSVSRRSQVVAEATVGTALPPGPLTTPPGRQLAGALTMKDAPERRLREERRASMYGPNTYDDMSYSSTGSYVGRAVFNELPFFLATSVRGDIAPTTPAGSAKLWTYTQPSTIVALKSLTAYCGDNIKALRAAGVFTKQLELSGTDTDWWRINAGLLGRQLVINESADTSTFQFEALTTQVSESPLNKRNILSIDDSGGTIGATVKSCTGLMFRWVFDPKIEPDFAWSTGGLDMCDIQRDVPEVTLELTTKWDATAVAEFAKRRDLATRLIRLESSSGVPITGSTYPRIRIDGAYKYTDFEPLDSERNGTQFGRLMLTAVEDTGGWNKKVEITVQNILTAADLPVV